MVTHQLENPGGTLRVGERFMMRFADPDLRDQPQVGRLQRLRRDGSLCFDVPAALRPRRGTPVELVSLRAPEAECSFASEILGRGRLHGNLPVVLVKAPESIRWSQRREAYRITVALKGNLEWNDQQGAAVSAACLVTDLSGTGTQVNLRAATPPMADVRLSLAVPDVFVDSCLRQRGLRPVPSRGRTPAVERVWQRATTEFRARFTAMPAKVIRCQSSGQPAGRGFHVLCLEFVSAHEEAYRLVRHLERQAVSRGARAETSGPSLPAAAG